jgi:hypothetical protein
MKDFVRQNESGFCTGFESTLAIRRRWSSPNRASPGGQRPRAGEELTLDGREVHEAANKSPTTRVVLLLEVDRPAESSVALANSAG